jgi:hypothetical protein
MIVINGLKEGIDNEPECALKVDFTLSLQTSSVTRKKGMCPCLFSLGLGLPKRGGVEGLQAPPAQSVTVSCHQFRL